MQCSGVVRVDFLYEEKAKRLYVNEVNSIPGSLSFNMFETRPNDIIRILVEEALKKFEEKRKIVYSFNSKAIESYIALTNRIKMGK